MGRGDKTRVWDTEGSQSVYYVSYSFFASVADPDPGFGAFLTPGSGIWNGFFPDPKTIF